MSQRGRTINPLATEIAARFEVRTGCWHERFANVRGLVPTLRPVAARCGPLRPRSGEMLAPKSTFRLAQRRVCCQLTANIAEAL